MKREIAISERPGQFTDQYLAACGDLSWYDFVTAIPSLVFVVTGWKANGRENACLHSWSSFAGSGPENFICILGKVAKGGHMFRSLKETGVCVLNFPSYDIYDRCIKTIGNNGWEADEITAAGLTAEPAAKVNAPRIAECFLNIECEMLWEHDLYEGSGEAAVALRAVSIHMDSERFDQSKLGRYGAGGYLYYIDQPTHPDTGEITPVMLGTIAVSDPIPWETK